MPTFAHKKTVLQRVKNSIFEAKTVFCEKRTYGNINAKSKCHAQKFS